MATYDVVVTTRISMSEPQLAPRTQDAHAADLTMEGVAIFLEATVVKVPRYAFASQVNTTIQITTRV